MGGSKTDPYCSCGEENLLGFAGDPYAAENILIHEFAHNIHLRGMVNVDATFDGLRLFASARRHLGSLPIRHRQLGRAPHQLRRCDRLHRLVPRAKQPGDRHSPERCLQPLSRLLFRPEGLRARRLALECTAAEDGAAVQQHGSDLSTAIAGVQLRPSLGTSNRNTIQHEPNKIGSIFVHLQYCLTIHSGPWDYFRNRIRRIDGRALLIRLQLAPGGHV